MFQLFVLRVGVVEPAEEVVILFRGHPESVAQAPCLFAHWLNELMVFVGSRAIRSRRPSAPQKQHFSFRNGSGPPEHILAEIVQLSPFML